MLEYARWKYILVSLVLLFALLFALPNVFGDDRALQISRKDREPVTTDQLATIEKAFKNAGVTFTSSAIEEGNAMVRFDTDTEQLRARDVAKDAKSGLPKEFVNAMMYASRAPGWMQAMGLRAMPLGLDLRGGLYLLYEVDIDAAVEQLVQTYEQDFRRAMREGNIPFTDISVLKIDSEVNNGLRVLLPAGADLATVRAALKKVQPDLECRDANVANGAAVDCVMTPQQVRERRDFAITSNITTLRNRVNTLGVSEPIVQRQGLNRIVVQLPGVQNSAEVKDILGKVATLEYRLEDPRPIPASGRAPIGAKIYDHVEGGRLVGKAMLKRDIIVTGNQLVNATTSTGQNGPQVDVTLDSAGGDEMLRTTRANVGKRMGVVFVEQRSEAVLGPDGQPVVDAEGKVVTRTIKEERVINLATIQGVFGNRFMTTGLTSSEARELSLLLRGGALTAPISIANEKTVTATLGEEEHRERRARAGHRHGRAVRVHDHLLPPVRRGREPGAAGQRRRADGAAVHARHRAHPAGHRRHHPHRRHGGGRQRADLRAHTRGIAQWRIAADRHQGGLREGVFRHCGFERHDVDRRRGVVRVRHRRHQGLRHRVVARHSHVHVHGAHGFARAAHAHVRRQAQADQAADRLTRSS